MRDAVELQALQNVYSDELNMRGNDDEIYCKPTPICAGYKGLDYSALDRDPGHGK